jgi:hypothetical protein
MHFHTFYPLARQVRMSHRYMVEAILTHFLYLLRESSKTSLIAAGDDSLFDSYPGENGRLPTNASEQAYWPG